MFPLFLPPAKKMKIPARSGYGSVVKRVLMKANHFLVGTAKKEPNRYDYVTIASEATSKTKRLEREFKVTISRQFLAGRQQDNPQETIQALDVVLRESASKDRLIVGRVPMGDGIEYSKGFYQSLRPTQMGLSSLNIDMSARAFYEPKLLSEFVGEFLGKDMSRPLTDQDRLNLPAYNLNRALKGVRVEVRHQDYKGQYKVQGLTAQPISQLNFLDEIGVSKTVVQYFREKYNVQLRFPALPAVQAGTDTKPTYLPMEAFNLQPLISMRSTMPQNIEKALVDLGSQVSSQLARVSPGHQLQIRLSVILPETKARIKRLCETELEIGSQCCKPQHVLKMSGQYLENVALKINVEVGGRNSVLSACLNGRLPYVTEQPTIIFGADVTHLQPGENSSTSIAAVVASMDWPHVTKYKALVSAQSHRQEIIQDLYTSLTDPKRVVIHGGLIRELLISFKKATGNKPHRLIFYSHAHLAAFSARSYMEADQSRPLSDQDRIKFLSGGCTEHSPQKHRKRLREHASVFTSPIELLPSTIPGKLLERIHRQDLTLADVEGDGNCQYRAVSRLKNGTEKRFMEVKNDVIEEMRDHSGLYLAYASVLGIENLRSPDSFKKYVDGLNKENEWGNYMTLYAAANKYKFRINLVCSLFDERMVVVKEILPVHGIATKEINMSYIAYGDNDAHYDALIDKEDVDSNDPPEPARLRLMITNLPNFVMESGLHRVFAKFVKVKTARLSRKLGIAQIEMKDPDPHKMNEAVTALDGNEKIWYEDGNHCIKKRSEKPEVTVVQINHFDILGDTIFQKSYKKK